MIDFLLRIDVKKIIATAIILGICQPAFAKVKTKRVKKIYTEKINTVINVAAFSTAKAYMVYDFYNNKVLKQKNSSDVRPIASLTKLMTANVFLKHQPRPELCLNNLGHEDVDLLKNTTSRLPKGENFTCEKLLQAMLIYSDNMAASALARSVKDLSKSQFIHSMNANAKTMGMHQTRYADSSGLSPGNVSTAQDLVLLMKQTVNNDKISNITARQTSMIIDSKGHFIHFPNTNRLIREYGFAADLSKTGYIHESGYNLIYVHKDLCNNRKIGFVILGANSSVARSEQAISILKEYGCPLPI